MRKSRDIGLTVALGLLSCVCAVSSCKSVTCPDRGTLVERYYAFDAPIGVPQYDSYEYRCFGPLADCAALCEELAMRDLAGIDEVGIVELCERVPSPDGWADAGYKGWEDAGYLERFSQDGGTADPSRILHLIARVKLFCGS